MAAAAAPVMNPGGTPDYFGTTPNYATSPIPATVGIAGDGTGAVATVSLTPAGAVAGVTVTNGGSGYTDAATTVKLIGGGGTGAVLNPVIDSRIPVPSRPSMSSRQAPVTTPRPGSANSSIPCQA